MSIRFDLPDAKIGDTFIQPFRFMNSDTGEPIDQTGQQYRFSLSLNPTLDDEATEFFLPLTIAASEEATAGFVTARLDTSQTVTLKPASYYYELKRVSPADPEAIVITLLYGKVKFAF